MEGTAEATAELEEIVEEAAMDEEDATAEDEARDEDGAIEEDDGGKTALRFL